MKDKNVMRTLARLERELKEASPSECAKLTKRLVALKDAWINQ